MTEAEWLGHEQIGPLWAFLRAKGGGRKLRLFACACCRRAWALLPEDGRSVVEVAERYADGLASRPVLEEAKDSLDMGACVDEHHAYCLRMEAEHYPFATAAERDAAYEAWEAAKDVACAEVAAVLVGCGDFRIREAIVVARMPMFNRVRTADLLRDVFGNPFRPVAAGPGWLTPPVVALARSIYEEQAFHRMPELANTLYFSAGCSDADILAHCRQPGGHVRGCWVLDLLLGNG